KAASSPRSTSPPMPAVRRASASGATCSHPCSRRPSESRPTYADLSWVHMAQWSEHALERLSGAGFRRGGARQAVIELLDQQPCALTVLDIEDRLRTGERPV